MTQVVDCLPSSEIISDIGEQIVISVPCGFTDTFRCRAGDEIPRRINSGWRKHFQSFVVYAGT